MRSPTHRVIRARSASTSKGCMLPSLGIFALSLAMIHPVAAQSLSGLDLGVASDYAFVSLGSGGSSKINSGPITGSVLIGQGSTLATSGGNNGGLTNGGIVFYDGTGSVNSSGLDSPPMRQLVSQALTLSALNSARDVSTYASSLTATRTFSTISSATTITGNGGLNVISLGTLKNAPLTISGGADDYFVFNVSGAVDTNQTMGLTGGIDPSRILWNLTATSGQVFKTAGGNSSVGTFLATRGGDFQFSNLVLNGALINAGGHIEFVSGSRMTNFSASAIPEPSSALLVGLASVFCLMRRRR